MTEECSFFTAAELGEMQFPALREIVPGVIVEGLSILAGPPKLGKSYLALQSAAAVATGGTAFGQIQCQPADVLYLALEDGQRRLQARLRQLLPYGKQLPDRLTFSISAPRVGAGLEGLIEGWIAMAEAPALVLIDTWICIKPEARGRGGAYDDDARAIQPLHALTKRHPGLAVVIVHHTRKLESDDPFVSISGTYGLTGVADSLLVLGRHGYGQKLSIRGRDIEEAQKALEQDRKTGGWVITGDARERAKTSERQAVLDALAKAGKPMGTGEVAGIIGKATSTATHLLSKLREDGLVTSAGYGKWSLRNPLESIETFENGDEDDGATFDTFDGFDAPSRRG